MTTSDMEKIIDRIRKLHAKAESAKAIGSLEEADAFATAVEKMLMKYKLSQATLTFEEKEAEDPLGMHWLDWDSQDGMRANKRRIPWIERLAMFVCEAHFCKIIVSRQSNNILIVGREQDRQVAEYMVVMLVRLGTRLADEAYRKERYRCWKKGALEEAHGYREAFLFGYVKRLRERYAEMRKDELKDNPGVALVVTRSLAEVDKFMKDSMKTKTASGIKMSASHSGGVDAGRRAADGVNLNSRGMGAGSESNTGRIKPGQRMLGKGGDQ